MAVPLPTGKADEPTPPDVDPVELLRAMLSISPDDAAAVREDAAEAMKPGEQRSGREAP